MKGFGVVPLRGYDAKVLSEQESVDFRGDEGLTQQHFAVDLDINEVMRRFGASVSPHADFTGVYGDFTGIVDYDSAVARIEAADARFMSLPPEVRERFGNDAGRLISAAQLLSEDEFGRLLIAPGDGVLSEVVETVGERGVEAPVAPS